MGQWWVGGWRLTWGGRWVEWLGGRVDALAVHDVVDGGRGAHLCSPGGFWHPAWGALDSKEGLGRTKQPGTELWIGVDCPLSQASLAMAPPTMPQSLR